MGNVQSRLAKYLTEDAVVSSEINKAIRLINDYSKDVGEIFPEYDRDEIKSAKNDAKAILKVGQLLKKKDFKGALKAYFNIDTGQREGLAEKGDPLDIIFRKLFGNNWYKDNI